MLSVALALALFKCPPFIAIFPGALTGGALAAVVAPERVAAFAGGGAGVLDRLVTPVVAALRSVGALVSALVAAVFATNVVAPDQFIAIVLPGRMFARAFESRGLAPALLSRTVAASCVRRAGVRSSRHSSC